MLVLPLRSTQSDSIPLASNTAALQSQEQASIGLPVRLKIPVIKVDAAIEYVGLTQRGAMDVPRSPEDVAWFSLGPRPGEKGSAVIAGHIDWKNGEAAVFNSLYKLRKGDKLYIEDDKGASISFIVREIRTYNPGEDVPDVFYQSEGIHINLITCDGVWDKSKKSYTNRLVVFADLNAIISIKYMKVLFYKSDIQVMVRLQAPRALAIGGRQEGGDSQWQQQS